MRHFLFICSCPCRLRGGGFLCSFIRFLCPVCRLALACSVLSSYLCTASRQVGGGWCPVEREADKTKASPWGRLDVGAPCQLPTFFLLASLCSAKYPRTMIRKFRIFTEKGGVRARLSQHDVHETGICSCALCAFCRDEDCPIEVCCLVPFGFFLNEPKEGRLA